MAIMTPTITATIPTFGRKLLFIAGWELKLCISKRIIDDDK
jgi:hypothetical protein